MQTIPLQSLPEFTAEVTLEGAAYLLTVKWSTRQAQWSMDIARRDGTVLVGGLGLLLGSEVLRNHAGRGLPPGALVLLDPAGSNADVTFDDLSERCALVYFTEAEYAAL